MSLFRFGERRRGRALIALGVLGALAVAGTALGHLRAGPSVAVAVSPRHLVAPTWVVTGVQATGGPLYPGTGVLRIAYRLRNAARGPQYLSGRVATVASSGGDVTQSGRPVPGCLASWFTVSNTSQQSKLVAAGASDAQQTVTITMRDSGGNQDACQGSKPEISISGAVAATASVGTLGAPVMWSATPSDGTVSLTWSPVKPPAGPGAVRYFVSRDAGAPAGNCPTAHSPSSVTSCTDDGVAAGWHLYAATAVWRSWTSTGKPASVHLLEPQTITFTSTPPSDAAIGGSYTVTASGGGSGNPVTFSIASDSSSVCSISGSRVTFIGRGGCRIDADQAGSSTYYAATEGQQLFYVADTSEVVPFPNSSPWLTPIPANAPLAPNSTAIVANLVAQIESNYGHGALNTTSYSAPIYTVPANQPTTNVSWDVSCQGQTPSHFPGIQTAFHNVPIPAGAVPSQGTDGNLVIWQPSTDTDWEFWRAAQDPATGAWSACWGGRLNDVSQNPGIFPFPYGVSASGLSILASEVRLSELAAGQINHALNLAIPDPAASVFSWPANRTDGFATSANAPAEGERLRLNPNVDLSTLSLSPGELIIARAMQQYGLIVTDTSGVVSIDAEDPRQYETPGGSDPYSQFFPGDQYTWLLDIPWNDLQVLPWNYGMPSSSAQSHSHR